eukprot:TRINITY_DN1412_c0_g1_i4.p1 TRINITY_DN1412_c0_g1~~TRINITY_DN1412_c0_g1_i4.p1  ORF type:complete len:381 (+),score=-8.45 TRINITY_DN1412_c0_g1_i4:142-1284(+)
MNYFAFISYFGYIYGLAAFMVLIYNFLPRRAFIKMLLAFYLAQNLIMLSFIGYHQPRPYFVSDSIKAIECVLGYGHPSGHLVVVFSLYGTLWILLFVNNTEPIKPFFTAPWQKLLTMWVTFALIILLGLLTFFGRLYLGVHTFNQLLYGLTLGLWVAYVAGLVMPKHINRHLDYVIENKKQLTANVVELVILGIMIALILFDVGLYVAFHNDPRFLPLEWLQNVSKKCPNQLDEGTPLKRSFEGALQATLYPLIYFSQLLSSRFLPNAYHYWYGNIGVGKLIARLVLVPLALGVSYFPYLATINASFIVRMGVGITISNLLLAFGGFLLLDWLCLKLHLVAVPPQTTSEERHDNNRQTVQQLADIILCMLIIGVCSLRSQ